jgi:hypothetical protein
VLSPLIPVVEELEIRNQIVGKSTFRALSQQKARQCWQGLQSDPNEAMGLPLLPIGIQ